MDIFWNYTWNSHLQGNNWAKEKTTLVRLGIKGDYTLLAEPFYPS